MRRRTRPHGSSAWEDVDALVVIPGLEFRPVTTDTVMTNFVTFEPDAVAPAHHHAEQQIAIILSGELTLTVGGETRVMRAGDCVVIPPHVEHGGVAGSQGCEALTCSRRPGPGSSASWRIDNEAGATAIEPAGEGCQ